MKKSLKNLDPQQGDAKFLFRAKKSLGQHFLQSPDVVETIVSASAITPDDLIVEVGPGEGVLTDALLRTGARVIAIEKDPRCIPILTKRFANALASGQFTLVEGDVLDAATHQQLFDAPINQSRSYKVVANIPYYITGLLFRFFLEHHHQPTLITFLVQKEVAEQIVSKNGKESILSLSVKIFGDPVYIATVPKDAFTPAPKVDSAILTIQHIHRERLKGLSAEDFFRIVKIGFRARRKMLLGNLTEGLDMDKEKLGELFDQQAVPRTIRGEDLPLAQWIALAKNMKKHDA